MDFSSAKDAEHHLELEIEEREKRAFQKSTFLSLLSLMIKNKKPLIFGFLMISFGTTATLLEPRIIGYAIDEAIIPKLWDKLQLIVVIFLITTLVRVVSIVQQAYFFELLGQKVTQELRLMLFSHLQRMPLSVFDKYPSGRFLTRVTNDIASLNEMFSAGFVSMICNILLVFGILIGMIILDLRLGLIASSVFPLLIMISVYFSRKLRVAYRDSRSKLSALNAFLAENLLGMKTIQLFNRQKLHVNRFERFSQNYADAQTLSIRVFAFFQPAITVAAGISIAMIIWFGGQEAYQGKLKLGVLVAFFSYAMALFQPVREIADKWNIFLSGMASAERVFEALNWKTELSEEESQRRVSPIANLRGHIRFENVWFAYEGENWILQNLSLEILPGQKVGIVGHTGAGKSTLIQLLFRFYEPQKGRIFLDGKELSAYDKRELRSSLGIVQQDVFLFSGTFEENITFWEKNSARKVESILSHLGLSRSSDEILEERGCNFSMGERQMIAFARALAVNPKIWILDEATSNMDIESEQLVQKALAQVSSNRTGILIAHRLATVKAADVIFVLHKGCLIESGNHEALMDQNGFYAKLCRFQECREF